MWKIIKKYGDLLGGTICGVGVLYIISTTFKEISTIYEIIQIISAGMALILLFIGFFKVIKNTMDEKSAKRKKVFLDTLVEIQQPMKIVSMAENPTQPGEKLGELIVDTSKGARKMWEKIKKFFDRFKGVIGSISLLTLSVGVEHIDVVNELIGKYVTYRGVNFLTLGLVILAVFVGIKSNTFSKEEWTMIISIFKDKATSTEQVKNILKAVLNNKDVEVNEDTIDVTKELNDSIKATSKEVKSLQIELSNWKSKLEVIVKLVAKVQKLVESELATNEDLDKRIGEQIEIEGKIDEINKTIQSKEAKIAKWQSMLNK